MKPMAVFVIERMSTNSLLININLIKMNKILILGLLISVLACNQKNKTENPINENEEKINSSLKKMYYEDSHNEYMLNDTSIFSKEIVELNRQCDSITNVDVERIAKSDHPTDKPVLREGSRISSFYEGVTDFKINEIKTINEKTEVTVTLSNKNYPTQKQWNEKIVFIDQNGLKIENIYFSKDIINYQIDPNLKKSLINFITQFD
jgi:signal recognition particle subunit SEC65